MFIVFQNAETELDSFDTLEEAQSYVNKVIDDYQEVNLFLTDDDFTIEERD